MSKLHTNCRRKVFKAIYKILCQHNVEDAYGCSICYCYNIRQWKTEKTIQHKQMTEEFPHRTVEIDCILKLSKHASMRLFICF